VTRPIQNAAKNFQNKRPMPIALSPS